jgi:hypothetical protein
MVDPTDPTMLELLIQVLTAATLLKALVMSQGKKKRPQK